MKRWLVLQAAGKRFNVKSVYNTYDYYTPSVIREKIVEWLGDRLYNYNTRYSHDISVVCSEISKIVKEKNIDMVIADNLSSLDIDELDSGINEQQKAAIKMLLRLSEQLGVVMHLVVHPRKNESFLRKNDIGGTKSITDLADNVFIVHRWNQDTQNAAKEYLLPRVYSDLQDSGTTNIVEVIKQREFGEAEGHIYKLFYEPESRRLKNSVSENIIYGWEPEPTQQEMFAEQNDLPFVSPSENDETPF